MGTVKGGSGKVALMPIGRVRRSHKPQSTQHGPSSASSVLPPLPPAPDLDILSELATNRESYTGTDWITLYSFPSFLLTNLDRIRARVLSTSKPSLSSTATCAISLGLSALSTTPDLQFFLTAKEDFDLSDKESIPDTSIEHIAGWFRSFSLSVPDDIGSGSQRLNLTVPTHLRSSLSALAKDLGISSSSLSILSIMYTLSWPQHSSTVITSHQASCRQAVSTFLRSVRIRFRVAETLIDLFKELGEEMSDEGGNG